MFGLDQKSVVRLVLFLLGWINEGLVAFHVHPIPVISDDKVALLVALVFSVWGFIQHNFLKKESVDKSAPSTVK